MYISEKKKQTQQQPSLKRYMHPSVALCKTTKIRKQLKHTSATDEWIRKMWYIYIHKWNTTQPQKELNFVICNNMDGFGGYSVK